MSAKIDRKINFLVQPKKLCNHVHSHHFNVYLSSILALIIIIITLEADSQILCCLRQWLLDHIIFAAVQAGTVRRSIQKQISDVYFFFNSLFYLCPERYWWTLSITVRSSSSSTSISKYKIRRQIKKKAYMRISLCTVLNSKYSLAGKVLTTIWLKILISRMIKLQFSPLNIAIIGVF